MRSLSEETRGDGLAVTHNVGDFIALPVHHSWLAKMLARCCGWNLNRVAFYRVTHVSSQLVSMEEVE